MNRTGLVSLVAALILISSTFAGVEIKQAGDNRQVKTDGYTANVGADGALTSVVYKGQELLKPGVSVSRGAYCFQNGLIALNKVEQQGDATIIAKADGKPTVTYAFAVNAINITIANATPGMLQYVFVLDPAWNVVGNDAGELRKVPTRQAWRDSTWYAGDKRARISGGFSIWPWMEHTSVAEADIAAGQTQKLVIELADVPAADAPSLAAVREGKFLQADLAVDSPKSFQVFQRRSKLAGIVRVSGHVTPNAEIVEVRVVGKSLDGELPDKWQPIRVDPSTHLFNGEIPTPAGGWYIVELHAKAGDKIAAQAKIENVGVGEVFVIAGQSNSTNYGEKRLEPASGLASTFDGNSWRPAGDPQPGTHDNSTGGSPWAPFADAMAEHYHVPVGIASTGHGGTSVNAWQPGGDLFRHTLTRVHELGYLGFRAVLWHQGESDVQMGTDEYFAKLANVISASRESAGWDFPWFVAQVSYHNAKEPSFKTTRDAQQRLWDQGIALQGPDTDALTGDNRDTNGAGIHLSEKGLRAHGKLWADKVTPWLDKALEAPAGN